MWEATTRRGFGALLFGGAAAALAGPATAPPAPVTLAPPPLAPPPPPPAIGSQPTGAGSFAAMLERAKVALARHTSALTLHDRIALADFSVHSRELRFHIVDLMAGQHWSYLCAHGRGSDPEHTGWLHSFSNLEGSLASSSGAYATSDIYEGVHGQSMRLIGLDPTNDAAEPRAIVIHGAPYVSENHIAEWGKCGRSEGCFAVPPHRLSEVLALLGPGRLLFADKV